MRGRQSARIERYDAEKLPLEPVSRKDAHEHEPWLVWIPVLKVPSKAASPFARVKTVRRRKTPLANPEIWTLIFVGE